MTPKPNKVYTISQRLAALLLVFSLTACSTISTSKSNISNGRVAGQLYYLPQGKVRVTGEWKAPPTMVVNIDPSKPAQTDTTPYSLFVVTITSELEADSSTRYYLKPNTNIFYSDTTQLAVNAKGLLTTGNVTTEDNTQAIVGTLAEIAAQGMKFGASGGLETTPAPAAERTINYQKRLKPFNIIFDPSEAGKYVGRLRSCGFQLDVDQQPLNGVSLTSVEWKTRNSIDGIVFRPLIPWRVTLTSIINGPEMVSEIRESKLIMLPDTSTVLAFDCGRAPFVKKINNIAFVDGVPMDYTRNLPSQVLGFLGIPKAVLTAIVPLPLDLKKTEIDNLEAAKKLDTLR